MLHSSKAKAEDTQRRLDKAFNELNSAWLTLNTLQSNFNIAQGWISKLERKLFYKEALIVKEREKNNKVLQELNVGLVGKDQLITQVERSINDLNDKISKLS